MMRDMAQSCVNIKGTCAVVSFAKSTGARREPHTKPGKLAIDDGGAGTTVVKAIELLGEALRVIVNNEFIISYIDNISGYTPAVRDSLCD